jgi:hypothetical protein
VEQFGFPIFRLSGFLDIPPSCFPDFNCFDKIWERVLLGDIMFPLGDFKYIWCFLFLLLFTGQAFAYKIVNAYPQFMEEKKFQRISEFIWGTEKPGPYLILRTQPNVRDGEYFIITLDKKVRALPDGILIKLEVVRSDSDMPPAYTLEIPTERPNTRQIYAGITGVDWPDAEVRSLAWKISFINSAGKVIAQKQSYLWTYP